MTLKNAFADLCMFNIQEAKYPNTMLGSELNKNMYVVFFTILRHSSSDHSVATFVTCYT